MGAARIAYLLGLNPSTAHRILRRYQVARLTHLDRASGRVIGRYEPDAPGDLVHVDIKKLGNIPDRGGHRVVGRRAGQRHRTRTAGKTLDRNGNSHLGYSYVHTAVDDHSRLAYSEILPDQRRETAGAFWQRARTFFAGHGIAVKAVLTDNGSCYKSRLWAPALADADLTHQRIRPYRPQTNGKVERFNRTMLEEWAYARPYQSEAERRAALTTWLHTYHHHRGHTALGGQPPLSRVINLSGQYT